jgi:hypothetical protein
MALTGERRARRVWVGVERIARVQRNKRKRRVKVPSSTHAIFGWYIDAASLARLDGDVPFEFVGQVARASALTEASHVEGGAAAARHCR